jgi:sulfoxide reductase heme-binding subunit YedZ
MHPAVKPILFLLCLLPFADLLWLAVNAQLGPDPAEVLMKETGEWAARLLIACLLVTPLRQLLGWGAIIKARRMLGLFCFFYASIHLVLFLHFYLGWVVARVLEEILERPYISVGFAAWLILLPLALTSTQRMQRRLRRNWLRLHRGIYPVAVLVSLHYLWQSRSDIGEALLYSSLFGLLLAYRLVRYLKKPPNSNAAELADAL